MALIFDDKYLRVEDIRIGKNVMQFNAKTYIDLNNSEIDSKLITTSYDLNGDNPFTQAYNYLITMPNFTNYKTDEIEELPQIATEDLISAKIIDETPQIPANDIITETKPKNKKKSKILLG